MKKLFSVVPICIGLAGLPAAALAQTCSKQSPAHTVALLELYTSEGCSSCPPADKFVSALGGPGLTMEQVVPLALHVDYWDYIGWKDVYANPAFGERQRWLSALAASRTVYTPELFVAGQELRGGVDAWRGGLPAAVQRINRQPAQADIRIALGRPAAGQLPLEVRATAAQGGQLYLALVENGLSSTVRAGENRGATLRHDHVVRQWLGPFALQAQAGDGKAGFSHSISRALALPANAASKNLGVAAFVQSDQGRVLQALSLPVCGV